MQTFLVRDVRKETEERNQSLKVTLICHFQTAASVLTHRLPHSAKPLHSKMSDDIFSCLECRQAALCIQREFAFAKFSLISRILPQ